MGAENRLVINGADLTTHTKSSVDVIAVLCNSSAVAVAVASVGRL
jgi:hypothetical protein